jgi:hypothetical protein
MKHHNKTSHVHCLIRVVVDPLDVDQDSQCNICRHLTDRQGAAVAHQGAATDHEGSSLDYQGVVADH